MYGVEGGGREFFGGEHDARVGDEQHRVAFGIREARVHAGSDGTELGAGEVGDGILGCLGQHERNDIAGTDTARVQTGGELVGKAVEVGIAEFPAIRGDVRRGVAEPLGGLAGDLPQHTRQSSIIRPLPTIAAQPLRSRSDRGRRTARRRCAGRWWGRAGRTSPCGR